MPSFDPDEPEQIRTKGAYVAHFQITDFLMAHLQAFQKQ